jgi:hypothetical protein
MANSTCFGQNKSNSEQNKDSLKIAIPAFWDFQRPTGIADLPDFYVNGYAFYPEKKIIGFLNYWIHPHSGIGIADCYIDTLPDADYNSFQFVDIDAGIAKDKDRIYFRGVNIGISPENARIIVMDSKYGKAVIIKENTIYYFAYSESQAKIYIADKIISDIVFLRNDSLFVFRGDGYYSYPENKFDAYTLKNIERNLYQDSKNLYLLYDGKVETIPDEQIIGKHTFLADDEEHRGRGSNDYFWIGKKNFYIFNKKKYNDKLQSYQFLGNSYYFFYNNCLYFFEGRSEWPSYPIGVVSVADAPLRDHNKAKTLGRDMLLYDGKELFYQETEISYPADMEVNKLEYIGHFPYRLDVELIPKKDGNCTHNSPVLRYNGQHFMICDNSLVALKKVEDAYKRYYRNFDLVHLKFLNEYYFTDGKTLYCNDDIERRISYQNIKSPFFTHKDIDLKKVKVFERYFSIGNRIYYNYQPVSKQPLSGIPQMRIQFIDTDDTVVDNPKDYDLSFINFEKLKLIPGTDYLTDENYLIYKNNMIGKIEYSSLKVSGANFVEDALHYFFENSCVKKEKLEIKLLCSD